MEISAASSANLFLQNHTHRPQFHSITFLCSYSPTPSPREAAAAAAAAALLPCRPTDAPFLPKTLYSHHHPLITRSFSSPSLSLLPRRTILPLSFATALSASQTQTQADAQPQTLAEDESIHTKDKTKFNTVSVKFLLQRECSFGQQFLMVGDDPIFGLWDPLNAIPLNWSDGHVWAVEMDIPCDKVIKYKFILKGVDDTILWQPGSDRILQTWETNKTITVCEDWDNEELQTVLEEEPVTHQLSESIEVSQVLKEAENLLLPNGSPESFIKMKLTSENAYSKPNKAMVAEKPIVVVAENITGQNGGEKEVEANGFSAAVEVTSNADKVATLEIMNFTNTGSPSNIEINLDSSAAVPVLVRGLTTVPLAETKEAEASISRAEKIVHNDSSLNVPEPYSKEEPGIDLPIRKEETENWLNGQPGVDEKEGYVEVQEPQLFEEELLDKEREEDGVLKNDIQWGQRTLQQFLVNLGLL